MIAAPPKSDIAGSDYYLNTHIPHSKRYQVILQDATEGGGFKYSKIWQHRWERIQRKQENQKQKKLEGKKGESNVYMSADMFTCLQFSKVASEAL